MNEIAGFFLYPPRSGPALLAGALLLQCCAARFAGGIPTWRLHADGQVARMVTEGGEEVGVVEVEPREFGVAWVVGLGELVKESE